MGVNTKSFNTGEEEYGSTTMGVMRVKQNIFKESSVGMIASVGDPIGRNGSYMGGGDFTYQTTRFNGDKNFLVGIWGLYTDREDLTGDRSAFGFKIDRKQTTGAAHLLFGKGMLWKGGKHGVNQLLNLRMIFQISGNN